MLIELDKGKATMLVLLDLSSAFNTIDHNILVEWIQKEFGITSCAKNWLESYLTDRNCRISVLREYSEKLLLKYGVPQGSVACRSTFFTVYAKPVIAWSIVFGLLITSLLTICSFTLGLTQNHRATLLPLNLGLRIASLKYDLGFLLTIWSLITWRLSSSW